MKVSVLVAKLFALLLLCSGTLLLYYCIDTGWKLDKTYPLFLFTGIVITALGVAGLLFKLK
ncbi:MAG: hypothetical protein ACUVQ0_05050 [Thermoproteota archaeon]